MSKDENILILSCYLFTKLTNVNSLKVELIDIATKYNIKGTIILAKEGFNASFAGYEENVAFMQNYLEKISTNTCLNLKTNFCKTMPFKKFKVKIKSEIVTFGPNVDYEIKGQYIKAVDWDTFISSPNVITIDTRNDYEVEIGSFAGAVNPYTKHFREFPEWAAKNSSILKNKKIAMFCTGGIRCEKSTAYLNELGFNEVYHLEGGILKYLADTGNSNNKWQGQCFVFDDRICVDERLTPLID